MIETFVANRGTALFIVGVLALILYGISIAGNKAAALGGSLWGLSIIVLVFVGLLGVPEEYFWVTVLGSVFMVTVGMVLRVVT